MIDRLEEGEDARFCDLGILPVTVKVGDDGTCNQVIVNRVPLSWNVPYHLKVVYDPVPCLNKDFPHVLRSCRYLLRIADGSGAWIPGASVVAKPGSLTVKSDGWGRAVLDVGVGAVGATISALGYFPKDFESTCAAGVASEPHEELIRLARK